MADTTEVLSPLEGIVEIWKIKAKNTVKKNDVLCTVGATSVRAKVAGELLKVCVEVGGSVGKGDVLALISPCQHPAILFHMCVACGERVAEAAAGATSALSLNGGQQLQLTQQEAAKVQTSKLSDLLRIKKLALILDLDHTLVHAMEISGSPPAELEEGVELLLLEDGVPPQPPAQTQIQPTHALSKTVIKHHLLCKRPHLDWFLEEAHKLCQMTIYTAGTRRYAEAVARIIDPTGNLFKGRMVSRSDVANDKSGGLEKSLQRLFLGDSRMAVVIDDREDVWKGEQASQLLLVKPFHHFRMGREINNASGPVGMGTPLASQSGPIIALSGDSPGRYLEPDQVTGSAPKDDQLVRSIEILRVLHEEFFSSDGGQVGGVELRRGGAAAAAAAVAPPSSGQQSMSRLLTNLKSQVLRGVVITFSGVIPVNEKDPRAHGMWRLAESLGAQVARDLSARTTHLLAIQTQTEKVKKCLDRGDVWVLHPDWLWHCRYAVAKVLEQTFMIAVLEPGKALPSPVLDSTPLGGDDMAGVEKLLNAGEGEGAGRESRILGKRDRTVRDGGSCSSASSSSRSSSTSSDDSDDDGFGNALDSLMNR